MNFKAKLIAHFEKYNYPLYFFDLLLIISLQAYIFRDKIFIHYRDIFFVFASFQLIIIAIAAKRYLTSKIKNKKVLKI